MFYADTVIQSTPALMCAYAFFGADHLLFGTDMPYDAQVGDVYTRETILTVERMTVSDSEKKRIFEDNARELMRLPV
jgi:aminocarboxymuconate-semialdehyde decarboxylase